MSERTLLCRNKLSLNTEEKFNSKQHINNKKGGLSKANLENQEDICQSYASSDFDI